MRSFFVAALLAIFPLHAGAQAPPPGAADPSPHRLRSVAVAPDVRLEVLDWGGAGEAMVFLTGMGNSAHVFDDFAPRFTDRYRVLGITRRGFGGSTHPEGGYDSETRAADIVAVLDSLRLPRAVLVGHSVAGDELTRVAGTYPERVRAVVYLDAYEYGPEFRRMQEEMPEVPQNPPPPPMTAADSASPQSFIAYRERLLGIPYPMGEALIHARFGPDGRFTGMVPRKEREVRAGLVPAELSRVAAPALAIYAPIESVEQFFERYSSFDAENQAAARHAFAIWSGWNSNARMRFRTLVQRPTVVLLRGGHHFLFITHPDPVEREIRNFLARELAGGR